MNSEGKENENRVDVGTLVAVNEHKACVSVPFVSLFFGAGAFFIALDTLSSSDTSRYKQQR